MTFLLLPLRSRSHPLLFKAPPAFAEAFQVVYSGKDYDYPAHVLIKERFITHCNDRKMRMLCRTIKWIHILIYFSLRLHRSYYYFFPPERYQKLKPLQHLLFGGSKGLGKLPCRELVHVIKGEMQREGTGPTKQVARL